MYLAISRKPPSLGELVGPVRSQYGRSTSILREYPSENPPTSCAVTAFKAQDLENEDYLILVFTDTFEPRPLLVAAGNRMSRSCFLY